MSPEEQVAALLGVAGVLGFLWSVVLTVQDNRTDQRLDHEDQAIRLGNSGRA